MPSFPVPALLAQPTPYVTRDGTRLMLGGRPFYFVGTNAYYLLEQAARGDTATVKALFSTARQLGMTVVRTWAFFDSADSLNPAVIQFRPGAFNERGLKALDYVLWQARLSGIRLILPLVNSWDDYGGMNQYVRWRMHLPDAGDARGRYTQDDLRRVISAQKGREYCVALSERWGHDDFYTDPLIRSWYRAYGAMLVRRVNTYSNVAYEDDETILAWELANEPRSSDRAGRLVFEWCREMAEYLKAVDAHHLVATGEEGFDCSASGYSSAAYGGQRWLFDGSAGVSFSMNSGIRDIDFAGIHLYPQAWGILNGAGNSWIADHVRVAAGSMKPLVVGEFGVTTQQGGTYDSWLSTAAYENCAGALVWQLLEGSRPNNDGFGIRCHDAPAVCSVLQAQAARFNAKTMAGQLPLPLRFFLSQNYPNPFNAQTTVAYDLPEASRVVLSVYAVTGERVMTAVDELRHPGERKELLDAGRLAGGAYVYQMIVYPVSGPVMSGARRMIVLK